MFKEYKEDEIIKIKQRRYYNSCTRKLVELKKIINYVLPQLFVIHLSVFHCTTTSSYVRKNICAFACDAYTLYIHI